MTFNPSNFLPGQNPWPDSHLLPDNLLYRAVQILSGRCDGARTQDGTGFNKFDSPFGKQLSEMSWEIWSSKQKHSAWKMLRKYRKQLAEAGIDYEAIPIPIGSNSKAGGLKLNGGLIEVWFAYRADLVTEVKTIPGRRWNPDNRFWTLPATPEIARIAVGFARSNDLDVDEGILALAEESAVIDDSVSQAPVFERSGKSITLAEIQKAIDERHAKAIAASQAHTADLEIEGLGGELRPFQKAGVAYAIEKKRLIIGDEMGLGKTIEALATVHALAAFPCLIVCPASLKFNWHKEAHKWLPGRTFQMLGGNGFGRSGADITIVNYDRLKDYREYLIRRNFQSIIGDESHYLKSPTAARTIYFEEIVNGCLYGRRGSRNQKADRKNREELGKAIPVRLLLTGTPIMNRPNEAIPQLQILDRLQEFGGYWKFNQRYCGYTQTDFGGDNSGHGHSVELNDLLRARCFVRRLKKEVLKELPPKIRTVTQVEITNREEYQKAEADLIAWLRETKGQEKADAAKRAEQLVRINELKQLAARGKMEAIKQRVEDFLDSGEKLVIFGWHKEIVRDIAMRFNCPSITGDTPLAMRDEYVHRFQEDDNCNLLACNIQAGGVGITLTAASNVFFCELGWNPAQMDQAGDRCHRIGQTDSVTEWWFVGSQTIEVDIAMLIEEKRQVVDMVTDGVEPAGDTSIMNALIDRLTRHDELDFVSGHGMRILPEEAPF